MRSESALRIQRKRIKEGMCRRCGERPFVARGDSDSPYCENCNRKANERQRERMNERKSAGYGPPPQVRPTRIHLPHPSDDDLTACGRELTDDNASFDAGEVTCSNCRRTASYRERASEPAAPVAEAAVAREQLAEAAPEPKPEPEPEPAPEPQHEPEPLPEPDPVREPVPRSILGRLRRYWGRGG